MWTSGGCRRGGSQPLVSLNRVKRTCLQCLESPLVVKHSTGQWTDRRLAMGPAPPSCPPDVTHVMNSPRFHRSSTSVYYSQQKLNRKKNKLGTRLMHPCTPHTQHYLLPGSWTWRGYSSAQLLHGMRPDWQPVWHAVYGGRCRYRKRGKKIWRTHRLINRALKIC